MLIAGVGSTSGSQAAAAPEPLMQALPPVLQWFVAIADAPAAPPVAMSDRVYVALRSGTVAAHRLADGARLWSAELTADQPLAIDAAHVYVAAGEAVYAIEGTSGRVIWRAPTGRTTAPPLVHAGWMVVAAGSSLSAFRTTDGSRLWRVEAGTTEQRPFIEGDALFAALADGRIVALNLQTGELLWERTLPSPPGEPLVVGDRLYVGSGDKYFNCIDADDGRVMWRVRLGAEVRGRPAADAARVYFAALDNELRALDLGSGAIRWHRGVPFRPSAGPIVLGDYVAIPGPVAELRVFETSQGTAVKGFAFTRPIVSAPAVLSDGEPAQFRIAAITGGLNEEWRLMVFGPPGDAPDPLTVLPLSELPGVVLPAPI